MTDDRTGDIKRLQRRIRVARGEIAPDLVLRNGRIVNVFSGETIPGDVAVSDGMIVGIGTYDGPVVHDVRGAFIAPGFMDGHFHVESAMLSPRELARAVLPHGTTAIVADPHELANVLGMEGIRYLIEASAGLPVDFFVMLPSCVPATDLETSGACLKAADLLTLKNEPRVLGLAEMMNYPGVIAGDPEVLDKVAAFRDRPLDGHAPLLTGRDLNAYIAAGLRSDHECTSLDEAREKLRLGMHLFIREGTQAKNLEALLPLVTPATLHRCSFVTDDLHPHDILRHGHLDAVLNQAIGRGLDPLDAIAMVTLNTARYFGLRDRGAVAPGYRADLVLLSSLSPIRVEVVYKNGRRVYEGSYPVLPPQGNIPTFHLSTMNVRPYDRLALAIPARGSRVRVMDLIPDQILTGMTLLDAPVAEGRIVQDTDRDLLKIAVIERHRRTGRIGLGLVRGFSLQRGALASSVAHDSHNILCVGADDGDMVAAARAGEVMGGGLAVACDGEVLARLALPIGGLMSDNSLEEIASGWESLRFTAQQLGCTLHEPFMHLSFLALPVIPALKITDRGLVDVGRFEIVPLCVEERG